MNQIARESERASAKRMLDGVESLLRYASRGCSAAACDVARVAWMSNQLRVVGAEAETVESFLRQSDPALPWGQLHSFSSSSSGGPAMTADEMQHFVERELPAVAVALRSFIRSA